MAACSRRCCRRRRWHRGPRHCCCYCTRLGRRGREWCHHWGEESTANRPGAVGLANGRGRRRRRRRDCSRRCCWCSAPCARWGMLSACRQGSNEGDGGAQVTEVESRESLGSGLCTECRTRVHGMLRANYTCEKNCCSHDKPRKQQEKHYVKGRKLGKAVSRCGQCLGLGSLGGGGAHAARAGRPWSTAPKLHTAIYGDLSGQT